MQNEKTTIVELTPHDVSTDGYLKLQSNDQPVILRFLPDNDFRGTLIAVEWNLQDNVKHRITVEDEDFPFVQVGERSEIRCPLSYFLSQDLPTTALLRIKFEFATFRAEPNWYGYLYLRKPYGDMEADSDAAYKIPRPVSSVHHEDCPCTDCACSGDCTHKT